MKTKKILFTIILLITIIFNINYVFATETDPVDEAQTLDVEPYTTDELNALSESEDSSDITEELPSTDILNTDGITNVSTVNSISQMNLQLNNILNIILIAIGVLLILFAIAILIRLKN